jgi:hypothetical protein
MNKDEYIGKLQIALGQAIHQHVAGLETIDVKGHILKIVSVEDVYVTANLDNILLEHLLSGLATEVGVEGTIMLFELLDVGPSSRAFDFSVRNVQVKYDLASEQFHVSAIKHIVPLGFSR